MAEAGLSMEPMVDKMEECLRRVVNGTADVRARGIGRRT
jgi:hypothetical protein